MRIPPLYREKSWQRFFAGVFIGLLFGWVFFIYHFGMVHEKLILELNERKSIIEKHEKTIEILQQDQEEQSQETADKLKVQDIEVTLINVDESNLSEMAIHDLRDKVESELDNIRGMQIDTVANSIDLLYKAIENKVFTVGDSRSYQLVIQTLILHRNTEIHVKIEPGP
ncbi:MULTISPECIES: sporulation membrane protein YtrI [Bacillaceae]|uniref:Sporulation membrane protein YtrI C-terminal domain-containing protein n=1 Tax=Evansella alkalicola TaxID=745819 RepID=A0ABS6JRT4_9BACI|nr:MULTISPECIES: sporulation membrane protein YtrI [Bacillaceae]MBU9721135.1 hypothetical protein [Bacillus alkalicola]